MNLIKRLELYTPIFQAPMAGVSTPAMAAAVSNAGGLGALGIGAASVDEARRMIVETQSLTKRAININVFCHQPAGKDVSRETAWINFLAPHFSQFGASPPTGLEEIYRSFLDHPAMVELLLELRPAVVSFHFGLPERVIIDRLKGANITLLATATNLDEARQIASAGVDAVVAQGYEAGGHRGQFDLKIEDIRMSTVELTKLLVQSIDLPVIAAGGIMDGADIREALNWGAQAAQLGTAFIGCPESSADQYFREALKSDAARNTVMTAAISGRPARCLSNAFTELARDVQAIQIPDYPRAYDAGKALNAAAKGKGHGGYGAQWAGEGATRARFLPTAELMTKLKAEIELFASSI